MRPPWKTRFFRSVPRKRILEAWLERQAQFRADLIKDNDPLVYSQEYMAEFVDWSGAAFFSREKLLFDGQPLPMPARCEGVFAIIDTASKTGTDNDATAVIFFASNSVGRTRLLILGLGYRADRRCGSGNVAAECLRAP